MNGSFVYTHFNSGEVSPEIRGRVDTKWYYSALKKSFNAYLTPYGNIKKRPGTRYVYKWSDCEDIRFIPFIYSETEHYVIGIKKTSIGFKANFYALDGVVYDSTGAVYEVDVPLDPSVNLHEIQYVQKDDVLYLTHRSSPVIKFIRIADDNWQVSTVSFNVEFILAYGDGSASKVQNIVPNIFLAPGQVQLNFSAGGTAYSITDDGNGNFVDTIIKVGTVDYATGRVYVSLNSATFDEGKPITIKFLNMTNIKANAICFFENRLILGGIQTDSLRGLQVVMGSVSGSYENFIFGTENNLAWVFEIASEQNNEIEWIIGKNNLIVGTQGGEYIVYGGSYGITANSISVSKQSSYSTAKIQPVLIENMPVFVAGKRDQIYGFIYDYATNSYKGVDLNVLNKDILKDKIKEIVFQEKPYPYLLCLLESGFIAGLLLMHSQGLMGWTRFYMGKDEESYDAVLSLASVPAYDGNYSKVWLAVKRFNEVWIETLTNPLYEDYFDAYYSDCSVEYKSDTATNTIPVPYPDGTECFVLTDKGLHPNVVVSNGQVSLNWSSNHVVVGLPYYFEIELLPFEVIDIPDFVSLNKPKSIRNIAVYLYKSLGGEIGVNEQYQFIYRTPEDLMDNPLPLFTGIKTLALYDTMITYNELYLCFRHRYPLPFNILNVSFDFYIGSL